VDGVSPPLHDFFEAGFTGAAHLGLVEIIFIFLFVDLFDNVGTLVAVCEQGGFVKEGKIPRIGRALLADGVDWGEFSEAFPSFVTLLATPLMFSIATGLSRGVITYTVAKVTAGKWREISMLLRILTVLFVVRFVYLAAE
jgi:xanthine/uracil/vitamin C permease (AzgA family)